MMMMMILKRKLIIHNKISSGDYLERDERVNHIINECSQVEQKKTKHDWLGKVIHLELCKGLNFDHTTKSYMHRLESIQENETRSKYHWGNG